MKKLIIVLLVLMAATVLYAKSDRVKTLTIRWEQPSLSDTIASTKCGVTEAELKSALNTIKKSLNNPNIEVHYGYYAATTPNEARDAIGRLWIDSIPLETWMIQPGITGNVVKTASTVAAECGAVSSDQVVKAALAAADRILKAETTTKVSTSNSDANSSKR